MKMKSGKKALCLLIVLSFLFAAAPALALGGQIQVGQSVTGVFTHLDQECTYTLSNMNVSQVFGLTLVLTANTDEIFEVLLTETDSEGNITKEKKIHSSSHSEGITKNGRTITYTTGRADKYAIDEYTWTITVPEYQWFGSEDTVASSFQLRYTFTLDTSLPYNDTETPAQYPFVGSGAGFQYYDSNPVVQTVDGSVSSWFEEEMAAALFQGFVQNELLSDLQAPITREEFAVLMARACIIRGVGRTAFQGSLLLDENSGMEYYSYLANLFKIDMSFNNFTDCQNEYVDFAYSFGFVTGVGESKFSPNATLTREQAAAMLARVGQAFSLEGSSEAKVYSDSGQFSSWSGSYISYVSTLAASNGNAVMGGTGDNVFSPSESFSREQAIVTIYRLWSALLGE